MEYTLINALQLASIFLVTAMVVGCDNSPDGIPMAPGIVNVEDDDPEMVAAIKTARETFWFFEKNWKTMESDGYSIKLALPTSDGELEHIWFSPTSIRGDKITGECANEPDKIPGLRLGDVRTLTRNDLSDWMIGPQKSQASLIERVDR